ncbi:hypothetical protein KCT29_002537 [Enterococcus faecalis]|nr:hypothetical protein [Enterococcus faecalis]
MHVLVCEFVDNHMILLNRLKENNIPYQNLTEVVRKWQANEKNAEIDKQIKRLEKSRPEI